MDFLGRSILWHCRLDAHNVIDKLEKLICIIGDKNVKSNREIKNDLSNRYSLSDKYPLIEKYI
jgi:hypothetical protein